MVNTIQILELFSGYGTATFALKQLGIKHKLIGYSDIDKYANQCFQQNHGGKELGDCTKINPYNLPDFNLLTGGFPCQTFSVAGKGMGELDTRGTLFNEIIRIAEVKKPKYMLLENVKGLTNKNHIETYYKILSELHRIGYKVYTKVLNTKDYGIPQNRERVFFVCFYMDYFDLVPSFKFPEKEELKIFLKDILEDEVDEKYYLTDEQTKRLFSKLRSFNERMRKNGIAPTLCSRDYKDPKCVKIEPQIHNCLTEAMGRSGSSSEYKTSIKKVTNARLNKSMRIGGLYDKDGKIHQAGSIYDIKG